MTLPPVAADATPLPVRPLPRAAVECTQPNLDLSDDGGRWESGDRPVFAWLLGVTALLAGGVAATFAALDR